MIGKLEARITTQQPSRCEPIHLGHLQVHENYIELRGLVSSCQYLYCFTAVVGHGDDRSGGLEQLSRDLLVHLVVFDDQDADSRGIMQVASSFLAGTFVVVPATPNRSTRVSWSIED